MGDGNITLNPIPQSLNQGPKTLRMVPTDQALKPRLLGGLKIPDLGFRVWGLRFRVWGLGFGVKGLGFEVSGLGFKVYGLRFRVWGLGTIEMMGFCFLQY